MGSEMDWIMGKGSWEVREGGYGCKGVGWKWVLKKKVRGEGSIEK